MLLDEPTQGMGLEDVDRIRRLIKQVAANRTVLMVEHNMSVVSSIADTITVLQRGRDARRRPVRSGVEEPGGDRGLHGQRRHRTGRSALMAEPYPRGPRPAGLVRRVACAARRRLPRRRRRGRHAARPQRRRPHQHDARDHGPDRHPQGLDQGPRHRDHRHGAAPHRAAGHRLLPGRARHLLEPERRGEPDAAADAGQGRHERRRDLRDVPEPAPSAGTARARGCPAASSRCWRWRASCAPARGCCCSTRSPKAWPR